jgi:hypothetical protein
MGDLGPFEEWTDERLTAAGVIARLRGLTYADFDSTIDEFVGFGWHLADTRFSGTLEVENLTRDSFIAHLNTYRAVQVFNKVQ